MNAITKREVSNRRLNRDQAAQLLGCHRDTLTHLLSEGAASAVLEWGGHGRQMFFSEALLVAWQQARDCRRGHGWRRCFKCWLFLEDAETVASHLVAVRHGVLERGRADTCKDAEGWLCGNRTTWGRPCSS